MSYEFIIYGDVRFDVSYDDNELSSFILSYIKNQSNVGTFTYLHLCRALIETAIEEKRLIGAKANTYYQSPQLKPSQYTRVSMLLWRYILKGIIFIDFYNNEYVAHMANDTTFGINKESLK